MTLRKLSGFVFSLLASAALLSGCAGYRLGTMLPEDIKTVHVPTFINQAKEPLLEVETTQATIEELQRDGSLTVTKLDQADSVLEVTLLSYDLNPVAYRSDIRTAAKEYRVTIFAAVQLKKTSDGSIITAHPRVKGEAVFELIGDLSSAKLTAVPAAADDLAHNIVEKIVEAW